MKAGDVFGISGYEKMAQIDYASAPARVLVVHNNSSHILVAVQSWTGFLGGEYGDGYDDKAVYQDAFSYYDVPESDFGAVYARALALAVGIAVGVLSDNS